MPETELHALAESFEAFADAYAIGLYPWQRDAFGKTTRREDGRFVHRLCGISIGRGNGKSWCAACLCVWRLLLAPPPVLILSVALDYEGSKILLQHGKAIVRGVPDFEDVVEVRADELRVSGTDSRWIVRSRDHLASRGLHPDVVVFDEAGWAKDDELFSSLLASQASVEDPLMLVISTVGRPAGPLWRIQELSAKGPPA